MIVEGWNAQLVGNDGLSSSVVLHLERSHHLLGVLSRERLPEKKSVLGAHIVGSNESQLSPSETSPALCLTAESPAGPLS